LHPGTGYQCPVFFTKTMTMGTEKYVSEVKTIAHPQQVVYQKLANLENLKPLLKPENIEKVREQIPNAPEINIEDFEATPDNCSFKISPVGKVGMKIVEREPEKTIKLTGDGTVPFQFYFWIQLVPADDNECKLRLTLHADLNPMIKMMVNKHLKDGIDKMAEAISRIPFNWSGDSSGETEA
jgi:carbon monoxide dehydrogenase subunit G